MGLGGGGEMLTPAYVLITVSKITDAEAFKAAIQNLTAEPLLSPAASRWTWKNRPRGWNRARARRNDPVRQC